jgi:hypothetical protein
MEWAVYFDQMKNQGDGQVGIGYLMVKLTVG